MKVTWSKLSKNDYYNHLDYLVEQNKEKAAIQFINHVEDIIHLISSQPKMYPLTDFENVRKGRIDKYISLFYLLQEDEVILLRFWDNRQNPIKLKLS